MLCNRTYFYSHLIDRSVRLNIMIFNSDPLKKKKNSSMRLSKHQPTPGIHTKEMATKTRTCYITASS